ncbi:hypothetical protein KBF61_03465 [Candidatus Saccharibacteria bacterium]|nr:hypothetical protein [Candidatus Saccharibacteria bacterium]
MSATNPTQGIHLATDDVSCKAYKGMSDAVQTKEYNPFIRIMAQYREVLQPLALPSRQNRDTIGPNNNNTIVRDAGFP